MRVHYFALLAITFGLGAAEVASAYALIGDYFAPPDVATTHESTLRWCAESGLSNGIQVGVEEGFETQMGALTEAQEEAMRERIAASFRAWENEVLRFHITFDVPDVTIRDPYSGYEMDLMAVTPEEFPDIAGEYGYAQLGWQYMQQRSLTNGMAFSGYAIVGADLYMDSTSYLRLSSYGDLGLDAFQHTMTHEIGHGIGLGHPNMNEPYLLHTNYDTDDYPYNEMVIDPADPFGDLIVSHNRNNQAIMSNRPCTEGPVTQICEANFVTELTNDDIGGRDVLYPVPEPSRLAMLAAGGCLVAARARPRGRA